MELRNLILAGMIALGGCSATPTDGQKSEPAAREPSRVVRDGAWELRIWYRSLGTRSETQHGALFHDDEEVTAGRVGEIRDTSMGPMRYYGPPTDGMPWEPTGWNYADRSKIIDSKDVGTIR